MLDKNFILKLFSHLESGNSKEFFNHVQENVHWTVMGTHPLAGIYTTKSHFVSATFARLNKVLKEGVLLKVENILLDENIAAIEMCALSTANNGKIFNNKYCWIVEFDNKNMIKKVRAYLDSALVQKVLDENE